MKVSSTDIIKKLLIAFLILGGLYYAKDFLVPLVIAGMLATLLLPVNNAMERHRIPRVMAILLSLLIVLAILSGIGLIFGLQIYDLSEDFALLKQKILDLLDYVGEKITAYTGVSVECSRRF